MQLSKQDVTNIFDILIITALVIILGEVLNSYIEGAMLAGTAYVGANVLRVVVLPGVSILIAKVVHYFICQHVKNQNLKKRKKSLTTS